MTRSFEQFDKAGEYSASYEKKADALAARVKEASAKVVGASAKFDELFKEESEPVASTFVHEAEATTKPKCLLLIFINTALQKNYFFGNVPLPIKQASEYARIWRRL